MRAPAIQLRGATRSFGDVAALVDVSFDVPPSSVTVLLGPNGAGKTTTVRTIVGALRLDGGSVDVAGLDPITDGERVRRMCGVVTAKPALYDRLSGRDNMLYAARLFGAGEDRVEECAARFGIERALGRPVGTYSTGMKTRLALARAMLHDPAILLLDEPTAGLDPESARAVLELIDETAHGGKTVLLCTHLLSEAERVADRLVIMDEGRVFVSGTREELTQLWWPHPAVVLDAVDPAALRIAERFEGVVSFHQNGSAVVELDDRARIPDLVAHLVAGGARLTRVEPRTPSLEDLYFRSRGRTA